MIQLSVLSGTKAGAVLVTRHFPVRVGRDASNHLRLEDEGIWDKHLRLEFKRREGYFVAAESGALLTVNGTHRPPIFLRNGDLVEVGAVRLRFWLGQVPQHRMNVREIFTWLLIAVMCLAQVALVYLCLSL